MGKDEGGVCSRSVPAGLGPPPQPAASLTPSISATTLADHFMISAFLSQEAGGSLQAEAASSSPCPSAHLRRGLSQAPLPFAEPTCAGGGL